MSLFQLKIEKFVKKLCTKDEANKIEVKKLREKVQENNELIAIKDEEIQKLNSTLKV